MDRQAGIKLEDVPNLDARLTDAERGFRKMLLNRLSEAGRALTLAELAEAGAEPVERYEALATALQDKGLLIRDDKGAIAGAYPVSVRPTSHRVHLSDGRHFYAMCAIDAMGCAFEFDQDVAIISSCSHCRTPLTVTMEEGRISAADPPDIHVLHVDLDHYADWAANC